MFNAMSRPRYISISGTWVYPPGIPVQTSREYTNVGITPDSAVHRQSVKSVKTVEIVKAVCAVDSMPAVRKECAELKRPLNCLPSAGRM